MDSLFENRYLVTDSEGVKYFSADDAGDEPPIRERRSGSGIAGGIMRGVGLAVSILIIVFAFILRENIFLFIGLALVAVYLYRIFFLFRKREVSPPPPGRMRPMELKWERVIRFGDRIVVDDPRESGTYSYGQIERMTENPAYLTLWFSDLSTLRVSKKGFIIGTCEDFIAYMEHVIARNSNKKATGGSK